MSNKDYTPTSINEIVYHSVTERQLIMEIASGEMQFPMCGKNGIILYGIWGAGKTTFANLLPDAIERGKGGADSYYEYVQCQTGQNGVNIMKRLRNMAMLMSSTQSGFHYFVLDEVDLMTDTALESLKALMNMPNTIFIMTTNNISNIDGGVRSRCHRINCNAAPPHDWLPFARRVLHDNGGKQDDDSKLLPIIVGCNGDAREIVCSMQKLASLQKAHVAIGAKQQSNSAVTNLRRA